MNIELFYFAGCPNWHLAQERLREALTVVGRLDLQVGLRPVETDEQARKLGFPGSPTIRINGRDPFPTADDVGSLSCRVYSTPEGLAGSPTLDQLVQALTQ
ncbi:DUF2703 domain-containing protein [Micromonospora sp. NBC_01655]|uniref:DF family (seleno)protein n=1 Tax=Micromonospora sp. NBC_01655 TaxID=2975983 RepID=UPI0022548760|nr:thioredoxin family protein [Micromonospora sp. NBC_01655]MCX4474698.1 DUF2703 domain-containing protein [Micromonospora sp. NBC_01655]